MLMYPATLADFPSMSTNEMLAARAGVRESSSTDLLQPIRSQNEKPSDTQRNASPQPVDTVEISPEGEAAAQRLEATKEKESTPQTNQSDKTDQTDETKDDQKSEASRKAQAAADQLDKLTDSELQTVAKLKARDAEVRAHEAAHKAVGGSHTGSVSYSYQTGPDGNRYVVGGEVSISTGKASTPEETIAKAQQVRAAALAPAQPSSQDLQVAAAATQMESAARVEKTQQDQEESESSEQSNSETDDSTEPSTPTFSVSA